MGAPSLAGPRTEDPSSPSRIPILPPLLAARARLWAALGQVHTQIQHPTLDPAPVMGCLEPASPFLGVQGHLLHLPLS